jgi:biofilm PGA synthesis lipoprotein PgaB
MLDAAGFTTITAAQFAHFLDGTGTLPTKPILITFDDGASSAWRVADPLLARYGMHAVLFVITSEIGRHAPYYISSSELRGLRSSGRWDLEAHTDNGHREIVSSPSDQWGPFLTNRMWLTSENRFETLAEYRTRVASDLDRCIAKLRALGVDPHLFAFPFSAATTPTNDPRVIPILFKLVAARFSASLIDSDQHRYVSRVLPNRYELPRFLVRSSTTARGLFEELASHAPFPHTGNLTDPAANWVVDQRALESAMRGQNGLTFAPPTRTWISAHWAPKNALPVRDATLRVVAARLGSAARGSAVTLVVRPDDNTLPATVTVGPSTLRIHGTTSLICSLAPAPSHRLSVTYQGSTLEVAVDDRSAATVQLATTAGSGIGIGAWRDSARSPEPVVRKLIEVSPTAFRIAKARLKCTTDIALPASSRNSRTQPSNGSTHTGDLSSGTPSRRIWRDS